MKSTTNGAGGTLFIKYMDGSCEGVNLTGDIEYERILEEYDNGAGVKIGLLGKVFRLTVHADGYSPTKVLREENESLRRRLQHLLQSEYIRSFDEWNPRAKDYVRDIKEADMRDTLPDVGPAAKALRGLAAQCLALAENFEEVRKHDK